MDKPNSTMAQQIAQAASAFEQRRTGHVPKSVTVVLSEDTLVITLHGALSPAEKALAKSPAGAAQVQEFHRQLFARLLRLAAAGDQTNHRGGGARSDRGSRDDDRHRGAGVLVGSLCACRYLEREASPRSVMKREAQPGCS